MAETGCPICRLFRIIQGGKSLQEKEVLELIVLNAVLWMTICFVAFVWIYFKPQLLVTKIGILLTIVAMGTVAVFTHKMIPLYRIVDEEQSNREYLNELLAVRRKENFMQTKLMNFYFISLSVGIGLYMYEHIQESSLQFRVVAYSVFLLWVGLNWFVVPELSGGTDRDLIV